MAHTLKYIDNNPGIVSRIKSFELDLGRKGIAGSGRKVDLHLKEELEYIEMKGSDTGKVPSWGKKNSDIKLSPRREFINDIIFSARSGAKFKWVISPKLDKDQYLKNMSKTVGKTDDDMDELLKAYRDKLKIGEDKDKYDALVAKIKIVREGIADKTIVEVAKY